MSAAQGFRITITYPQGKATVTHQKTASQVSIADAMNTSPGDVKSLVDVESAFTFDSTTPANALITVTTR